MDRTPEIENKINEILDKLAKLDSYSREDVIHIVHEHSFSDLAEDYSSRLNEYVEENRCPEDVHEELDACNKELDEYLTKYEGPEKTVGQYWKRKGIDYKTLENIIDHFPEDSNPSNLAKELMQELTDHSFEDDV